MAYTESGLIESYRELKERLGRVPSKTDFEKDKSTPSTSTVIRFFGKWSDFVIACGDVPPSQANAKGADAVEPNRKTVRLTDDVINIIGNRNKSRLINNLLLRIESVPVSFRPDHVEKGKNLLFKYPDYVDQGRLLSEFSQVTGFTMATSIIVLELIEREL